MDYYTIRAQRHFLDRDLKGTRIEAVRLRDKYSLFIGFTGETAVKLSCTPDMPYLHRIEKRFLPVKNSHDWHLPRLKGQAVAGIALTPGDRIRVIKIDGGLGLQFRDSAELNHDNNSLFLQLDVVVSRAQAQEIVDALQEALK